MSTNDKKRYPTGTFEYGKMYSLADTRKHIRTLARFPKELKKALKKLNSDDYDQAYRKDGWTVRQVVHHLADSHINAYVRMKLAVTETTPVIKPYEEANWAETEDGKFAPIKLSIKLLNALHHRWILFLESLSDEDLDSSYFHPEMQRVVSLQEAIALYSWHSTHHLGHILLVAKGIKTNDSEETIVEKPIARAADEERIKSGPKPKAATASTATEPKKRGPKPKIAAAASTTAEPKKRGPKPKIAAAGSTAAEPKKRGPKPKIAAAAASTAAEPKKRGPKPKIAAAAASTAAEPKKRGPKPKIAAATDATPGLRGGRIPRIAEVESVVPTTGEQEEMSDYMKLVNAVISGAQTLPERNKRGPKSKAETAALGAEPKKRGPKPKVASAAAEPAEPKKRGPKPKVASAASEPAEPKKRGPKPKDATSKAVTSGSEAPKRKGMSPEHMAKIREARMANIAARKADEAAGKTVAAPKKAGKAKASDTGDTPKRKGMSPEHMAKIREARMAKIAARKAEENK